MPDDVLANFDLAKEVAEREDLVRRWTRLDVQREECLREMDTLREKMAALGSSPETIQEDVQRSIAEKEKAILFYLREKERVTAAIVAAEAEI